MRTPGCLVLLQFEAERGEVEALQPSEQTQGEAGAGRPRPRRRCTGRRPRCSGTASAWSSVACSTRARNSMKKAGRCGSGKPLKPATSAKSMARHGTLAVRGRRAAVRAGGHGDGAVVRPHAGAHGGEVDDPQLASRPPPVGDEGGQVARSGRLRRVLHDQGDRPRRRLGPLASGPAPA